MVNVYECVMGRETHTSSIRIKSVRLANNSKLKVHLFTCGAFVNRFVIVSLLTLTEYCLNICEGVR